jgi:aryl-alcohol dehydrogenase-like predicted oxidoreductase
MAALCGARGVGLLCYGSLAGGFVDERWLGAADPGTALANRSLVKYRLIIEELGGWARFQELLTVLAPVARRHRASIAAVAIAWVLERPGVAGVIVGSRHAGRLAATLAACSIALTAEDRAAIEEVLAIAAGPAGDTYGLERDRAGRHGAIMKYNLNAGGA